MIAGTTGLIGNLLLDRALQHPLIEKVVSLSRQPLNKNNPHLIQMVDANLQIDVASLPANKAKIGFITLGSTKKKAGNKEALKEVDVTLVVNVAKAMLQVGVKSIYVVSCIGASQSAQSKYLQNKGEMESAVEALR